MSNVLFTGGVWVMYADVARIKVRKASNCSLGDRLCSFAKIPMFVGPIQQTIITPRRVLGGGRAVSAVRLGTAMDQTFLHDFVNKSELTKELSSVRTSGGVGHGAGTHGDGAASGRGEEGSQRRVWTAGRRRVITRARGSSCILQRCILHGSEHVIRTHACGRD